MNRGIYTAVNGLLSRQIQQDIIAENIANINTPGYKKNDLTFETFYNALIHAKNKEGTKAIGVIPHGSQVSETFTDHSIGPIIRTDAPYDFAILEDGFFIVETPEGDLYTRNGNFKIDSEGYLVTAEGYRVIGYYDDYIHVENGELDQPFAIANPPKELLLKVGEGLYRIEDQTQENVLENPRVERGALEGSNVDLAQELSASIEALRLFQINQRMLLTQDELLRKAANEVGSLR